MVKGKNASFCNALLKFNAAVFQVDISEDTPKDEIVAQGKKIAPLFATVAKEAPDELASAAAELDKTIQALTTGDAKSFNDDATFTKYTGLVDGAIGSCGFETIDITGVDYAYQGVPKTIKAGTAAFKFTNASKSGEHHMMAILKKKDGVDLTWDEILALPDNQGEDKTEFKGEAEAEPGKSSQSLAELDAGSYAMVCFISVGGKDDGPPHFTQGDGAGVHRLLAPGGDRQGPPPACHGAAAPVARASRGWPSSGRWLNRSITVVRPSRKPVTRSRLPMQGVIKSYDPGSGDGVVLCDTDFKEYDLATDALRGSVFRMLRQGQRVIFDLDDATHATRLRLGSEVDMGTPGFGGLPGAPTQTS